MISLRQHQIDGDKFIMEGQHLGSLLWHGMGLGKTLTSLHSTRKLLAMQRAKGVMNPKFMVVIPKSASPTWQAECMTNAADLYKDMLLIPYSQLNKAMKLINYYDIRVVILDESQKLKTPKTNRGTDMSNMLKSLGDSTGGFKNGKFIMLSGTPMENSAAEIYTSWAILAAPNVHEAAIRLLDEKRYDKWGKTFAQRKEVHWKKHNGQEKSGATYEGIANPELLQELLAPIVHYRRVEDCIDLPEKQEIHIDLKLPDDKLLDDANIEEPEAYMALLEKLARAKTPHLLNWIADFMAGGKEQLVVFSNYRFPLQELYEKYPSQTVLITGEQTGDERKANITAFQTGKKRIIGLTYKAGAESLNLQNAHTTLYHGFPWHKAAVHQAMARTYRSGQKNFTLHYFMMSGQNDIRIRNLVEMKGHATQILEEQLLKENTGQEISLDNFI